MDLKQFIENVEHIEPLKKNGKVKAVKGLIIEVVGLDVFLGEVCQIILRNGNVILAEVIGFDREVVFLMTYEDLDGIGPNNIVKPTGKTLQIEVSNDMVGHVFNGIGKPISDYKLKRQKSVPIMNQPPNPLSRGLIDQVLVTGVKAIDSLLTVGVGQRMGIFAGSGVGKSTLTGMIVRNSQADINVICLVGERGRELKEFIERDLGEEGMKRSIVIVTTSDESSLMRIKASFVATAIAEHFRDQGLMVNLFMDSVTRLALAQRELGLSLGEPPTTRGFTPSVFSLLPRLLERTGKSEYGAITAFYTVLVEGDDLNEPIVDAVRGILDGHIILSRKLAEKNHYPAIDIGNSISRLYNHIVEDRNRQAASTFRTLYSTYKEQEDLINIGAYKTGQNKTLDKAIRLNEQMNELLKQDVFDYFPYDQTMTMLQDLIGQE